jgi:anti-anti-sigma factor
VDLHDDELRVFMCHVGSRTQLEVGGEVDMVTADQIAERLDMVADFGGGDVEIDMSLVTFCDSTGLKVLLDAHERFSAAGRQLRIARASDQVLRLLHVTGTHCVLMPGTDGLIGSAE